MYVAQVACPMWHARHACLAQLPHPVRGCPPCPRYSFVCYTRRGVDPTPVLPPTMASRHEEYQVGRGRGRGALTSGAV